MNRAEPLQRIVEQHVEAGHIVRNADGSIQATDKGKERAQRVLDRVPIGDEILLEMIVLERHGITVQL